MNRDEILKAEPHHVRRHLNSLGVIDHRFEKNLHYHSARLRKMAEESPLQIVERDPLDPKAEPKTYEFYSDLADQLDSYHAQMHHKGTGRIVVWSDDEVIQKALDLADGKAKVHGHRIVQK